MSLGGEKEKKRAQEKKRDKRPDSKQKQSCSFLVDVKNKSARLRRAVQHQKRVCLHSNVAAERGSQFRGGQGGGKGPEEGESFTKQHLVKLL